MIKEEKSLRVTQIGSIQRTKCKELKYKERQNWELQKKTSQTQCQKTNQWKPDLCMYIAFIFIWWWNRYFGQRVGNRSRRGHYAYKRAPLHRKEKPRWVFVTRRLLKVPNAIAHEEDKSRVTWTHHRLQTRTAPPPDLGRSSQSCSSVSSFMNPSHPYVMILLTSRTYPSVRCQRKEEPRQLRDLINYRPKSLLRHSHNLM